VACLKARHDQIEEASKAFTDWIEAPENADANGTVIVPHTHNKDDEIAKLALARAMLRTSRKCSISQK
jgi:hypothetical protein